MRTQRNTEAKGKERESMEDWHWHCKGTVLLGDISILIQYEESYSNLNSERVHITEGGCNVSSSAAVNAVSQGFSFFCPGWKASLLTTCSACQSSQKAKYFTCKVENDTFDTPNLKSVCFDYRTSS